MGIVLYNHSETDFKIEVGDRVAQLILEKIELVDVVLVNDLDDTERSGGGFGSTGLRSCLHSSLLSAPVETKKRSKSE